MKKLKKVLTRTLPRYYWRSRKRYAPLFKPAVSVADQETQADLSDEDRKALFAEWPFHFLSSPESDTKVEEHLNTSPSDTYPIPQVLGYENENVDRWLQRFALYLANKRIHETSKQAAIQLALHLSGPAESFYYNLCSTVQGSYVELRKALQERFAPAHRSLRLPLAIADLNEKFSCLNLRGEDNLSYLIQGLRADIQAEILKKEPKTYVEAEDTARLIYSIHQPCSSVVKKTSHGLCTRARSINYRHKLTQETRNCRES